LIFFCQAVDIFEKSVKKFEQMDYEQLIPSLRTADDELLCANRI
jgi:hypothetical protein